MKKLFFELDITWKRLIIAAVVTAIIVGGLNCIPALADTSFTAPAVNPEFWLLVGLILACNAKSGKDAMAKVFVFFLISQPLIYLVEVPFSSMGWGLFSFYPRWGVATILTIPAALATYQIRQENVVGILVAIIAVGIFAFMGAYYIPGLTAHFPHMLLASVFCFACAICTAIVLIPKKAARIIALALAAVVVAGWLFLRMGSGPEVERATYELDAEHTWQLVETDSIAEFVEVEDGYVIVVTAAYDGGFDFSMVNELGEVVKLQAITSEGMTEIRVIE